MIDGRQEENINKFVSQARKIPFLERGRDLGGWDCWGLIWTAYQKLLGVALPEAAEQTPRQPAAALEYFMEQARNYPEISYGEEHPLDVLFFKPCHAGLVLRRGWMLNARAGRGTLVERYDNGLWRPSLLGIYRYAPAGA